MKKLFLSISLCLFYVLVYSNNVHISFMFDKPTKLFIKKPVDGLCNTYYVHDTLDIKANITKDYCLSINDLSILAFGFPGRIGIETIYISPNDTLRIYRENWKLYTKGGHEIINNYRLRYSYRDRELKKKGRGWVNDVCTISPDEEKKIRETYKITGIPYGVLLDRSGKILHVLPGNANLEYYLKSIYGSDF